MDNSIQNHWNAVYKTKRPDQVSWTQEVPKTSLDFIHSFSLAKNAKIIDIGGGDSKLVDHLLKEGYEDITVLDISEKALEKVKARLGDAAKKVKWIVSDIVDFVPTESYTLWHDRATFHFLTTSVQIKKYMDTARKVIDSYLTIGTFSVNGPETCSGLAVKQYSETALQEEIRHGFNKIRCINEDHVTPFNTSQSFLFCSFKKNA